MIGEPVHPGLLEGYEHVVYRFSLEGELLGVGERDGPADPGLAASFRELPR